MMCGYKLHMGVVDSGIPLVVIFISVFPHNSQVQSIGFRTYNTFV